MEGSPLGETSLMLRRMRALRPWGKCPVVKPIEGREVEGTMIIHPSSVLVLCGVLTCTLGLSPAISAQSPGADLVLIQYRDDAGMREYHYELRNHGLTDHELVDIAVDVLSPRGGALPALHEIRGDFLVDAFQIRRDITDRSRPDLGIHTPAPWSAAIYIDGVVSWGAPRFFSSSTGGVSADERLGGFVMTSEAVPAFRWYTIVSFQSPEAEMQAAETQKGRPQWSGWVVAPGWRARFVEVEYVQEQYATACSLSVLAPSQCESVSPLLARLSTAEDHARDAEYDDLLRQLLEMVTDWDMAEPYRDVLTLSAEAARARPPSSR
jgi:hypothetical protein